MIFDKFSITKYHVYSGIAYENSHNIYPIVTVFDDHFTYLPSRTNSLLPTWPPQSNLVDCQKMAFSSGGVAAAAAGVASSQMIVERERRGEERKSLA